MRQLVFGYYMIPLIKHKVDWELMHQIKQTKINNDNIRKNKIFFDQDYKVRNKVVLNNNAE